MPPAAAPQGTVTHLFAGAVRALRSPRAPGRPPTAWKSAILKTTIDGPVHVGPLGLAGDAQHDRRWHGGPTKAVLCYAASHYAAWAPLAAAHLPTVADALAMLPADATFAPGAFGENVLLAGLDEATVCIGDAWRVGGCVLRVTEPRGPCGTLARRWAWPALATHVRRTARAGWYCAVDAPGPVAPGDAATLVERLAPAWTIARVFMLLESRVAPAAEVRALAEADGVHDALRARLERRLATPGRTR